MRLIAADGQQVGIVSLDKAMTLASEAGLDLVEVGPTAKPPVCRLMDYGRKVFENSHKQRQSRRVVKEMKYRIRIGPNDFNTKTRQVSKFLGRGDKVKITVMFRGREMSHQDSGRELIRRIEEAVAEVGHVEDGDRPKVMGRDMTLMFVPGAAQKKVSPPVVEPTVEA